METILNIMMWVLPFNLMLIPLLIYIRNRIPEVAKLRTEMIRIVGDYNTRNIDAYWSGRTKDWAKVYSVDHFFPSFQRMLYSFKPLKIESFITQEKLHALINDYK